jgi:hypothetical protein
VTTLVARIIQDVHTDFCFVCLFIYSLLNEALSSSHYTEQLNNETEGSGRARLEILCLCVSGGIEENYEKPQQGSRCHGRYSNRAPPVYKVQALLHESVLFVCFIREPQGEMLQRVIYFVGVRIIL